LALVFWCLNPAHHQSWSSEAAKTSSAGPSCDSDSCRVWTEALETWAARLVQSELMASSGPGKFVGVVETGVAPVLGCG
jgi:hypothetical protein